MLARRALLACLAALLSGQMLAAAWRQAPSPQPSIGQGGAFRSGVEVVSLNVTVTDAASRYVTDLSGDDFSVSEDGVKQDIGFFSRTNLSLSVALLIDSSASMEEKMRTTQAAALGFVRTLRPQDQAQVIDFDSRVSVVAPLSSSRPDLEKAITSTVAGGSTSLYTAVYIALRELKKTQSRKIEDLRRQAVIVLSDGEDTSSLVSYDEVLDLAKRSETAIYAIGIRTREPGSGKGYSEADFVLRELTTQTGGRAFFPVTVDELPSIYALISQELSSQYLIGYTPMNARRDGGWRRIIVRTSRPGTTARTRTGYYAPAS